VGIKFVAFAAFKHNIFVIPLCPVGIGKEGVVPFLIVDELWFLKFDDVVAPVSPTPHNKGSDEKLSLAFDDFVGINSGYRVVEIMQIDGNLLFFFIGDEDIE
jgi:hypothetical protein